MASSRTGVDERPTVATVFAAHRLALVRLAILLVDDLPTAEDVVQDAFAGLVRSHGDGADINDQLAYLRRAVVNNAGSVLRRRRTARGYVPPHEPGPAGPESEALLADEHREVLTALRRLGQRQREVLVLRYWSDLSEAEIAATLDISKGAVKSLASRGVAALREHLGLAE
ncbi:SigE family RNA polymerase sigma factor [Hamadaea sp. NPDC051192]|uniref:SigE family RNA polymerase sigma factor n=1 Tax=Hamadaea sp. NPDC051192 TaxID=3154940 RepID=UPI0034333ABA